MASLRLIQRGYSLVETTVSVAVLSIVMTAVGSVFVMTSQVLPGGDSRVDRGTLASAGLRQVADELRYAVYISERTPTSITFTLADRDQDGYPERIRYAWDGVAGSPLTREYNGGTPVTVIDQVAGLSFTYETTDRVETYPGPIVTSAEQLISTLPAIADTGQRSIKEDDWVAQQITIPAGSGSWQPTRVRFRAEQRGSDSGDLLVQIRSNDPVGGTPTNTVLAELDVPETDLPTSYAWHEATFETTYDLASGQLAHLVFAAESGASNVARIQYAKQPSGYRFTTDFGNVWDPDANRSVPHEIFGVNVVPGPDQTLTRHYSKAVTLSLSTEGVDGIATQRRIVTPNRPELLSAYFALSFDSDPTGEDVNGDGLGDWGRDDGLPFDINELEYGVWDIDSQLDSSPGTRYGEPITVELRFIALVMNGKSARVRLISEPSPNQFVVVYLDLERNGLFRQALCVVNQTSATEEQVLGGDTNLGSDYIEARLVLDPVQLTANLQIDGEEVGTFPVVSFPGTSVWQTRPTVSLYEGGAGSRMDWITVRVGGTGG